MNLPMLNQQPAEKRVERDDGALEIVSIFATIQGEGPYAGTPAVFIRTAGCVLQCPLCDTDYTSGRELLSYKQVTHKVLKAISKYDNHRSGWRKWLVVITGGEPFRQSLSKCVQDLMDVGLEVQIETNGILYDEKFDYDKVCIVCSPKLKVHDQLWDHITALKYVVKAGQIDSDGLPTSALELHGRPAKPPLGWEGTIYVQPADEQDEDKNKLNMEAAVKSCMDFGYQLCIQVHKYARLP